MIARKRRSEHAQPVEPGSQPASWAILWECCEKGSLVAKLRGARMIEGPQPRQRRASDEN